MIHITICTNMVIYKPYIMYIITTHIGKAHYSSLASLALDTC